MKRFRDMDALLSEAERQLKEISTLYQRCLQEEDLNPRLGVLIKNFFENIRSPLDYLAKEICGRFLSYSGNTGFPISSPSKSKFDSFIKAKLPDLENKHLGLYKHLGKIQKYNDGDFKFLPMLSDLVNGNKHDQLSPQTRVEKKTLDITFPGGASIRMGHGTAISGDGIFSSGGGWFTPGGGTISPETPASIGQNIHQSVTKWIAFEFKENGKEVMTVLRESLKEVKSVLTKAQEYF